MIHYDEQKNDSDEECCDESDCSINSDGQSIKYKTTNDNHKIASLSSIQEREPLLKYINNSNDEKMDSDVLCRCRMPAILHVVNKNTVNKGKKFFGCGCYDHATKQTKCKFFQWHEINKSSNGKNDDNNQEMINISSKKEDNKTENAVDERKKHISENDKMTIAVKIIKNLNEEQLKILKKEINFKIRTGMIKKEINDCNRETVCKFIEQKIVFLFNLLRLTKDNNFEHVISCNNDNTWSKESNIISRKLNKNNTTIIYDIIIERLNELHEIFHASIKVLRIKEVTINYVKWTYSVLLNNTIMEILKSIGKDNDHCTKNKHFKPEDREIILKYLIEQGWFHLEAENKTPISLEDWRYVRDYIHNGKILHDASILIHCDVSVIKFAHFFGLKRGRILIDQWKMEFHDVFNEKKYISTIDKMCDITIDIHHYTDQSGIKKRKIS